MSISVENSFSLDDPALDKRAHLVPCHIDEDGPAKVQKFFEPYVCEDDNKVVRASLRGRPLSGGRLPLPPAHSALLLTETRRPLDQNKHRKLQVAGGFKSLIYWNYDKEPSGNDAIVRVTDWLDIAEAMHGD